MKNIATCSVLIQDVKGSILFIIDRNKIEFNEQIKIVSGEYYKIGSSLLVGKRKYTIINIQFTYHDIIADFQTAITVE